MLRDLLRVIFFIILLLDSIDSSAQVLWKPDYTEACFGAGFVVKNYPTFPDRPNPVYTGSIGFAVDLNGYKFWHHYYNHPRFGINLVHASLGNRKQLGSLTSIVPNMTFSWKLSDKCKFFRHSRFRSFVLHSAF